MIHEWLKQVCNSRRVLSEAPGVVQQAHLLVALGDAVARERHANNPRLRGPAVAHAALARQRRKQGRGASKVGM